MKNALINSAIDVYITARRHLLSLGDEWPDRIGGNDNLIGRIGEFIALRFLESIGQTPKKVLNPTNAGFDFRDGGRLTQVKVITKENTGRRIGRLTGKWTQFVLIELDPSYAPLRIGILAASQHRKALTANPRWSKEPIVKITMLNPGGLVGRYGEVHDDSLIPT